MAATLVSKDRILKLLGSGLSNEAVATAVGCDASYIAQLMAEEAFKDQVIELRSVALTAATERDRKADTLEERALDRLDDMLNWITKPGDMLKFFQILNAAKRRGTTATDNLVINQQIVNLQLPAAAFQKLVTDGRGEVVEIDGQSMLTMQPETLIRQIVSEKGNSDVASKALRALRNKEIATAGYQPRTDGGGNRATISQGQGGEDFSI
jgi:D-arabinose 1-dehydrogenase-like Zn-dependent alcohol dehydrogenase